MNIFTHLSISMKLKHIIEMNLPVKLRTSSFLLGNIKPDISSQYAHIRHYKKDAEGFIREQIQALLEMKIYEFRKCTHHFSERLGIVTHYLSDFFCYAHSEHYKGGILAHIIYEMKLCIHDLITSNQIPFSLEDQSIVLYDHFTSIYQQIEQLHQQYLSVGKRKSNQTDMIFTIKACTILCISIISTCMVYNEGFANQVKEVLL